MQATRDGTQSRRERQGVTGTGRKVTPVDGGVRHGSEHIMTSKIWRELVARQSNAPHTNLTERRTRGREAGLGS